MRSIGGINSGAVQGAFDNRALNKLGGAIDMASTGYSNDIQYNESTGGTVYSLGQQVYDVTSGYIPQFWCQVFYESNPEDPTGDPLYFLRIAKGNVTYTWNGSFPLTQGTSYSGVVENPYLIFPAEQLCIFDTAVYPISARTTGTDVDSVWFANGGKYKIDKTVGSYYVTISYLDYADQLDWFADEVLIHTNKPWVSLVAATGDSKNALFTNCTPTMIADYIALGSYTGSTLGPRGSMGLFPTQIGYSMKVIARIDWDDTNKVWKVVQEMVGPITFDQNPMVHNNCTDNDKSTTFYNDQVTAQFSSTIVNKSYVDTTFKVASFVDSNILDPAITDWWYDVKTI